jgi:hypothetical protein
MLQEVMVDSTRARVGAVIEWIIAAAGFLAVVGFGSLALQLRTVDAVTPVIAEEKPAVDAPASVASKAVSVPMLVLSSGARLHVGDRLASASSTLKTSWQVGVDAIDRGPKGDRITRSYVDGATPFQLVLESVEPGTDPQIAAIYLR